jgi:uncharacterized membrane protein
LQLVAFEWVSLILRWAHVITAMAWIGASFYFMHIDASLRPVASIPTGKGGEVWEVHGGGFYQVRKYLVAPPELPDHMIWHKWQAYMTWVTGIGLLVWVYYLQADLYTIDPAVLEISAPFAAAIGLGGIALGWVVYDLLCKSPIGHDETKLATVGFAFVVAAAWAFGQVFSGRAALIHTGALMATIMTANVAMIIIPNQKKVVADLIAGRTPDAKYGKQGKQRSTHNNYLTLPVVFLMLSNHYPLTYAIAPAWLIVALTLIAGALVRVFYNLRHAGRGDQWWTWGVAAAAMVLAALVAYPRAGKAQVAPKVIERMTVSPDVQDIVVGRCSMCHARLPVWSGIVVAPKGVVLETAGDIERQAAAIRLHAVATPSMPPNNVTGLTADERAVLARWLEQRQ